MRKQDKHNFLKVGVFVSTLTFILMIMVMSIGKETALFKSKLEIKARVISAANLKPGSYVELKGIRVGTVTQVEIISQKYVEITMKILEEQMQWIRKDSKISISSAGLVGDKFIEIRGGSNSAPILDPEKDYLVSESARDLNNIISKGESVAELTERILSKIDQVLYNLDDGRSVVESVQSMNRASYNLEMIMYELRQAEVGKMVKNINRSMNSLSRASHSMENIMSKIESGPGTMNSLIYDDSLHDDLRALLGGANRNKIIKYFIRESIRNAETKKEQ